MAKKPNDDPEARFRSMALGMTGAEERSHMGHPDFRAAGRIFATLHADHRHGMVALRPEQQAEFLARAPEAFLPEVGVWGQRGATRVRLAAVDPETLGEALTLAWRNVVERVPARKKRPAKT